MDRAYAYFLAVALSLTACGTTYSTSSQSPTAPDAADEPFVLTPDPADAALDDPISPVVPQDAAPVADAPAGHGPPYPIVLVHGFAGFNNIGPINYFFEVAADLRAHGEVVYESEVAPFLPPVQRGPMLAAFIDGVLRDTGSARVILLAHSQGGLDARYVVSTMHYGDRVAAVVTVATPHRGTRLADAITGAIPGVSDVLLNAVASVFGFTYNSARTQADLRATLVAMSEGSAAGFNRDNPDDPRVLYWSWAGRSNHRDGTVACHDAVIPNEPSRLDTTFAPLLPFVAFLEQGDPAVHPNDGLVEVPSARWGRFMGCVPADHFDEIGQIAHIVPDAESGFDHKWFYRDIVRRLRDEGL